MTRLLIAAAIAMVTSLVGTHFLIQWLTRRGIGQPIRDDGPDGHHVKAGTPTMGGIAIVAAIFVGYVISDLYNGIYTRTGSVQRYLHPHRSANSGGNYGRRLRGTCG